MRVDIRDRKELASLSLLNLRSYLKSRRWVDEGEWGNRATIYSAEHDGRTWEILCPLRDTIADYAESMAEAIAILATVEDRSQLDVFHDLAGAGADVIQIRSPNGAAQGTLSLRQNARMLNDAHDLLAAAARAAETPRAAYRGRLSADVASYLDAVQPLPGYHGGYALTLHSPVPAGLGAQLDFGDAFVPPFPRQATSQLAKALDHATEAIVEAVAENTVQPFELGVPNGVSANLCESVAALANKGQGIQIDLFWAGARPSNLPDSQFRFTENSADILTEAAKHLRRNEPSLDERIIAQVVRLEREPDEFDGRAVILSMRDERLVRMRVEFERPVYDMVIKAFQDQKFIRLSGDIYPDGSGYALRRPHDLALVEDVA